MSIKQKEAFFYVNSQMHRLVYYAFLVSVVLVVVISACISLFKLEHTDVLLLAAGLLSSYLASYMFYYLNNVTKEKNADKIKIQRIAEIYICYQSVKELLDIDWKSPCKYTKRLLEDINIYVEDNGKPIIVTANVLRSSQQFIKLGTSQINALLYMSIDSTSYFGKDLIAIQSRFLDLHKAIDVFCDFIGRDDLEIIHLDNQDGVIESQKKEILIGFSKNVSEGYNKLCNQVSLCIDGVSDRQDFFDRLNDILVKHKELVMSMGEHIWYPSLQKPI